jgi:glycosyltransferase involved in cell wall biosynthesis
VSKAGVPSFVVFSDDWGEHMSSCQHIFNVIGKNANVLWVNTIGMRAPRLSSVDVRKIWLKGRKMAGLSGSRARSAVTEGIAVRQPLMLPYSKFDVVRRFNAASLRKVVGRAMRDLQLSDPCVVATVPNACDYLDAIGASCTVYYCVDDFAEWPGNERELVREMEEKLIERADALVATSQKLYGKLKATGKPTTLLTHGVDMELFATRSGAEHPSLAKIPTPRAGYFGLFDERSDQHLIAEVAERLPHYAFVFAGPVEASIARLERQRNVHFIGPIDYRELPEFIAGMNALLLPYTATEFADSLSPLKLKEYLATGKPVISTPIADVRNWEGDVAVGTTAAEWVSLLLAAESERVDVRQERARRMLAGETWSDKAAALLEICTSCRSSAIRG